MMIWLAIVFSTVIYFVIALQLANAPGDFEQLAQGTYVPVLYAMALLSFVFGWFLVRRLVKSNEQTRLIVALAVFETCAIFGLLGAVLTQDWRVYLFPWALALIGFVRELPRESSRTVL